MTTTLGRPDVVESVLLLIHPQAHFSVRERPRGPTGGTQKSNRTGLLTPGFRALLAVKGLIPVSCSANGNVPAPPTERRPRPSARRAYRRTHRDRRSGYGADAGRRRGRRRRDRVPVPDLGAPVARRRAR